jgi:hypothetical protein
MTTPAPRPVPEVHEEGVPCVTHPNWGPLSVSPERAARGRILQVRAAGTRAWSDKPVELRDSGAVCRVNGRDQSRNRRETRPAARKPR